MEITPLRVVWARFEHMLSTAGNDLLLTMAILHGHLLLPEAGIRENM